MSKRSQLPRKAKRGSHRADNPEPLAPPGDPGSLPSAAAASSSREQSVELPRDSVQYVKDILEDICLDQQMTRNDHRSGDSPTGSRSSSHRGNRAFGSDSSHLSCVKEELPPELSLLTVVLDKSREEFLAIAEQTRAVQAKIAQQNQLLQSLSRRLTEIHRKSSNRSPIDERSARTSTTSRQSRASNAEPVEPEAPSFVYNEDEEMSSASFNKDPGNFMAIVLAL